MIVPTMAVEPPTEQWNHLADFTNRDYRPDHEPHPTPSGISLGPMDPRKVASLLGKVAAKSKGNKKVHAHVHKPLVAHKK